MTVRIFDQPLKHRAVRPDADPRLLWTACGIRFMWDPAAYQRAQAVMDRPEPTSRCEECFA